jgi:hypothetical protein
MEDDSVLKPIEETVKAGVEDKRAMRKAWIWIMLMVNIVFILVLMTLGIIALRVGNYLPDGTDILFLVGNNPSVEVGDEKNEVWEAGQEVDIFQASYVNGEGKTTVVSQDGSKLIAPGTETQYKYTMYNSGNMAVSYETDLGFVLKIGDQQQENYQFPLFVRLKTESGGYLIGSDTEWVDVQKAVLKKKVRVLGAESYETFILELKWAFEGGSDELDTMYGNQSSEKGVKLTLSIETFAQEHLDSTAQGGTRIDGEKNPEYGGTVRWLWLALLFANIGILIFYISWLMNKRLQKW